jgi:GNAT superfamily N-acetyltransferase
MNECVLRPVRPEDEPAVYHICLKTGDNGQDGAAFYRDDPDALGRIFAGPYLRFSPELGVILEDDLGVCGYALGALNSREFFARCDAEWRPTLCARYAAPTGDPTRWTRVQQIHQLYHHPDYFCPEPYALFPSHLHIDLLVRAQGRGYGRRMLSQVMENLRGRGSPGVHVGVSPLNVAAQGFYQRLGFHEMTRVGTADDGCLYFGKRFTA